MNILVSGGAGFIGSNFIRLWLKQNSNDHVINLDKLTYAGNLKNLAGIDHCKEYHFEHCDIADREEVHRIFSEFRPQMVVHFAAETHVDRSITGPEVFIITNVLGTQILLDAALEFGVEKFLYVSTDEVYGPAGKGISFTEEGRFNPSSPYAASKAGADHLAMSYFKTYHLPVVISRCSNNYGPYQYPEKFIPLIIRNCLNNCPVPVYGDGQQTRDWLFVEDHCTAIATLLNNGVPGQAYNIAGRQELKNIDLVRILLDQTRDYLRSQGWPYQHIGEQLINYVDDRPAHDFRYGLDDNKIRTTLGWQPASTFDQGIESTVRWYVDHPAWLNQD